MGRDLRGRLRRVEVRAALQAGADMPLVVEVLPAGMDGLTDTRELSPGVHRLGAGATRTYVYHPASGPDPAVLDDLRRRFPTALQIVLGPEHVPPPADVPT
ncbi:hypothetical protein [Urbifossiella limnaea]|uniref:Uncharacterized protein n=1 Tax=Urbifossiella limnaea TaxID=2528023 RepID=A0A517XQF3_9BACT|nr:hypothetical protein [Urbifossiella limnaea]QDU19732.1 hypothetical protein ETAA1_16680 [Urbifossiella limnaea]